LRRIEDAGILMFGTPRMIMLLSLVWQISLPCENVDSFLFILLKKAERFFYDVFYGEPYHTVEPLSLKQKVSCKSSKQKQQAIST